MSAWARPGVKCVCVDDSPHWMGIPTNLVKGAVYTIVEIVLNDGTWTKNTDTVGVKLSEVRSSSASGFNARRFRPLITKTQQQDVALFTHHFSREGADA